MNYRMGEAKRSEQKNRNFNHSCATQRSLNQKEESGILTTEAPRHREKKAVGSRLCASVPLWFMLFLPGNLAKKCGVLRHSTAKEQARHELHELTPDSPKTLGRKRFYP